MIEVIGADLLELSDVDGWLPLTETPYVTRALRGCDRSEYFELMNMYWNNDTWRWGNLNEALFTYFEFNEQDKFEFEEKLAKQNDVTNFPYQTIIWLLFAKKFPNT